MEEIFKDILGFEGLYQVSNFGNIKSTSRERLGRGGCMRICPGRILKHKINNRGYHQIDLFDLEGKSHRFLVHRLVALTFLENPNNLPQINHKDETKRNNIFTNLEWCDCKYNNNYGNHKTFGNKKVIMLDKNNNKINIFDSVNEASKKTNIIATSIGKCCNKKQKTAGGYVWEYYREEDKLCN